MFVLGQIRLVSNDVMSILGEIRLVSNVCTGRDKVGQQCCLYWVR